MEEVKNYNAKIKSTWLGLEEDGSLYLQIAFDSERGVFATEKQKFSSPGQIKEILLVLGVNNYEDLPRKFARIKVNELTKKVVSIGNIIEPKWIDLTHVKF